MGKKRKSVKLGEHVGRSAYSFNEICLSTLVAYVINWFGYLAAGTIFGKTMSVLQYCKTVTCIMH